jgi:hypothetical protein
MATAGFAQGMTCGQKQLRVAALRPCKYKCTRQAAASIPLHTHSPPVYALLVQLQACCTQLEQQRQHRFLQ